MFERPGNALVALLVCVLPLFCIAGAGADGRDSALPAKDSYPLYDDEDDPYTDMSPQPISPNAQYYPSGLSTHLSGSSRTAAGNSASGWRSINSYSRTLSALVERKIEEDSVTLDWLLKTFPYFPLHVLDTSLPTCMAVAGRQRYELINHISSRNYYFQWKNGFYNQDPLERVLQDDSLCLISPGVGYGPVILATNQYLLEFESVTECNLQWVHPKVIELALPRLEDLNHSHQEAVANATSEMNAIIKHMGVYKAGVTALGWFEEYAGELLDQFLANPFSSPYLPHPSS
ncbi:MAG: hypothetical protein SGCHY_000723 [Lobulomycetales sp.]